MNEDFKKCHNCKGKGKVDGGAAKHDHEVLRLGNCAYCNGTGFRDLRELRRQYNGRKQDNRE